MIRLDMHTIVFTGIFIDIICTLVVAALWRQNRGRFAGMAYWVADFSLQTAGILLIALRGTIPDWASIVLANTLIITGSVAGLLGLERFVGKKGPQWQNYLLLAVFPLLHAHLAFIAPSLRARNLNVSAALLVVCCQCAWLLFRRVEPAMRPLTRLVGAVFAAFSLTALLRIVMLLRQPDQENDFFRSAANETFVHIGFQMLFILLTYSLTLMVNQRLLAEIRTLSGLLPICSSCKKIRDDKGYWNQLESYIQTHTGAEFTHGICPDCMKTLYPSYRKGNKPGGAEESDD